MFAFIQDGPRTRWLQARVLHARMHRIGRLRVEVARIRTLLWFSRCGRPLRLESRSCRRSMRVFVSTPPPMPALALSGGGWKSRVREGPGRHEFRRSYGRNVSGYRPAADETSRLSESAAFAAACGHRGRLVDFDMCLASRHESLTRQLCPNGSESLVVRADHDAVCASKPIDAPRARSRPHESGRAKCDGPWAGWS
jgi:hypothetical protein